MAVAEMSVMTLIGLSAEKNAILDGLQKCGAVQIRNIEDNEELTRGTSCGVDVLSFEKERIEQAISVVNSAVAELPKNDRPAAVTDGIGVSKEEFFAMEERRGELAGIVCAIEELASARAKLKAEAVRLVAEIKAYEPYLPVKETFDFYKSTKTAAVYLGTAPKEKAIKLAAQAVSVGAIAEILSDEGSESVVAIVVNQADNEAIAPLLSQASFKRSPFFGDTTARSETEKLYEALKKTECDGVRLLKETAGYASSLKDLMVLSDYVAFLKEKAQAEEMMAETQTAFVLEAFVPTEAVELVKAAIASVTEATYTEFIAVPRDEPAPTLNRNGRISENFEVVTNMYSSPAYGALDPNAVMAFFFSLFMGVIMADVGYGIMMIAGGLFLAARSRKGTSINRMAKVFAYGGIFAIAFGALFDGFLGFQLLHRVLGEDYSAFYAAHINPVDAKSSIAGIDVPTILLWCLGLGTAHMAVGLILKAVQCFTRGRVLEGVFGGLVWAVGLFGLIATVFLMVTGSDYEVVMIITVGAIAVGILTAGVGGRGADYFIKPFTAAYGLINYVSDILSYARLYGLMLAGSQIASIFTNTLALDMLMVEANGIVGIVFGVIIIIVGNVFNLAISLLGAYIHDARLQYVEFYGKFYEGEGELFTPFGSKLRHSYFKN